MAFNINAQVILSGPKNLKTITKTIKSELATVSAPVNLQINKGALKQISSLNQNLTALVSNLDTLKTGAGKAATAGVDKLSTSLRGTEKSAAKSAKSYDKVGDSARRVRKEFSAAGTEVEAFGKDAALAIRRFTAFTLATGAVFGFVRAVQSATSEALKFQREIVKVVQVTGESGSRIDSLTSSINNLSVSLGVDANELAKISRIFAQTGQSLDQVEASLRAVARSTLTPSFGTMEDTTEGLIAAMAQFNIQANRAENVLGSLNAVAKKFAVESQDLISVVRRAGGIFSQAAGDVDKPIDALNQLIGIFTAVRSTTRESADTISVGLRTIFTRIQRRGTIDFLKQFNVELVDAKGNFVGLFPAFQELSRGLDSIIKRGDALALSTIAEELGGIRQVGKLIPAIANFNKALAATKIAGEGAAKGLGKDVALALQPLGKQFEQLQERFSALVRSIADSKTFQGLAKVALSIANAFLSVAETLKPLLPLIATFAAVKISKGMFEFGRGFLGGLRKGGGTPAVGETLAGAVTAGGADRAIHETEKKTKAAATHQALTSAIKLNTTALDRNTSNLNVLTNVMRDNTRQLLLATPRGGGGGGGGGGGFPLRSGGRIRRVTGGRVGYNDGGPVLVDVPLGSSDAVKRVAQKANTGLYKQFGVVGLRGPKGQLDARQEPIPAMNIKAMAMQGIPEIQVAGGGTPPTSSKLKKMQVAKVAKGGGESRTELKGRSSDIFEGLIQGIQDVETEVYTGGAGDSGLYLKMAKDIAGYSAELGKNFVDEVAGNYGVKSDAIAGKIKSGFVKDNMFNFSQIAGNVFEAALSEAGGVFGDDDDYTVGKANRAFDFPTGVAGKAAEFFGVPPGIPTDAKSTTAGQEISMAGKITSYYADAIRQAIKTQRIEEELGKGEEGMLAGIGGGFLAEKISTKKTPDGGTIETGEVLREIFQIGRDTSDGTVDRTKNLRTEWAQREGRFHKGQSLLEQLAGIPGIVGRSGGHPQFEDLVFADKDYGTRLPNADEAPELYLATGEKRRGIAFGGTAEEDLRSPVLKGVRLYQQRRDGGAGIGVPAMVTAGEAFISPKGVAKAGVGNLEQANKTGSMAPGAFSSLQSSDVSIFSGPGGIDNIPADLPAGGYVIRKDSTQKMFGNKNGGRVAFARGGIVGRTPFNTGGSLKRRLTEPLRMFTGESEDVQDAWSNFADVQGEVLQSTGFGLGRSQTGKMSLRGDQWNDWHIKIAREIIGRNPTLTREQAQSEAFIEKVRRWTRKRMKDKDYDMDLPMRAVGQEYQMTSMDINNLLERGRGDNLDYIGLVKHNESLLMENRGDVGMNIGSQSREEYVSGLVNAVAQDVLMGRRIASSPTPQQVRGGIEYPAKRDKFGVEHPGFKTKEWAEDEYGERKPVEEAKGRLRKLFSGFGGGRADRFEDTLGLPRGGLMDSANWPSIIGKVLKVPGYLSTSSKIATAGSYATSRASEDYGENSTGLLSINTKRDYKALDMRPTRIGGGDDVFSGENEVVLPKNARFEIMRVESLKDYRREGDPDPRTRSGSAISQIDIPNLFVQQLNKGGLLGRMITDPLQARLRAGRIQRGKSTRGDLEAEARIAQAQQLERRRREDDKVGLGPADPDTSPKRRPSEAPVTEERSAFDKRQYMDLSVLGNLDEITAIFTGKENAPDAAARGKQLFTVDGYVEEEGSYPGFRIDQTSSISDPSLLGKGYGSAGYAMLAEKLGKKYGGFYSDSIVSGPAAILWSNLAKYYPDLFKGGISLLRPTEKLTVGAGHGHRGAGVTAEDQLRELKKRKSEGLSLSPRDIGTSLRQKGKIISGETSEPVFGTPMAAGGMVPAAGLLNRPWNPSAQAASAATAVGGDKLPYIGTRRVAGPHQGILTSFMANEKLPPGMTDRPANWPGVGEDFLEIEGYVQEEGPHKGFHVQVTGGLDPKYTGQGWGTGAYAKLAQMYGQHGFYSDTSVSPAASLIWDNLANHYPSLFPSGIQLLNRTVTDSGGGTVDLAQRMEDIRSAKGSGGMEKVYANALEGLFNPASPVFGTVDQKKEGGLLKKVTKGGIKLAAQAVGGTAGLAYGVTKGFTQGLLGGRRNKKRKKTGLFERTSKYHRKRGEGFFGDNPFDATAGGGAKEIVPAGELGNKAVRTLMKQYKTDDPKEALKKYAELLDKELKSGRLRTTGAGEILKTEKTFLGPVFGGFLPENDRTGQKLQFGDITQAMMEGLGEMGGMAGLLPGYLLGGATGIAAGGTIDLGLLGITSAGKMGGFLAKKGIQLSANIVKKLYENREKIASAIPAFLGQVHDELINSQLLAKGGRVGTGTDTVPALLTPGEFVINKSASENIGYSNLKKMNRGGVVGRKYAEGGPVKEPEEIFALIDGYIDAFRQGLISAKNVDAEIDQLMSELPADLQDTPFYGTTGGPKWTPTPPDVTRSETPGGSVPPMSRDLTAEAIIDAIKHADEGGELADDTFASDLAKMMTSLDDDMIADYLSGGPDVLPEGTSIGGADVGGATTSLLKKFTELANGIAEFQLGIANANDAYRTGQITYEEATAAVAAFESGANSMSQEMSGLAEAVVMGERAMQGIADDPDAMAFSTPDLVLAEIAGSKAERKGTPHTEAISEMVAGLGGSLDFSAFDMAVEAAAGMARPFLDTEDGMDALHAAFSEAMVEFDDAAAAGKDVGDIFSFLTEKGKTFGATLEGAGKKSLDTKQLISGLGSAVGAATGAITAIAAFDVESPIASLLGLGMAVEQSTNAISVFAPDLVGNMRDAFKKSKFGKTLTDEVGKVKGAPKKLGDAFKVATREFKIAKGGVKGFGGLLKGMKAGAGGFVKNLGGAGKVFGKGGALVKIMKGAFTGLPGIIASFIAAPLVDAIAKPIVKGIFGAKKTIEGTDIEGRTGGGAGEGAAAGGIEAAGAAVGTGIAVAAVAALIPPLAPFAILIGIVAGAFQIFKGAMIGAAKQMEFMAHTDLRKQIKLTTEALVKLNKATGVNAEELSTINVSLGRSLGAFSTAQSASFSRERTEQAFTPSGLVGKGGALDAGGTGGMGAGAGLVAGAAAGAAVGAIATAWLGPGAAIGAVIGGIIGGIGGLVVSLGAADQQLIATSKSFDKAAQAITPEFLEELNKAAEKLAGKVAEEYGAANASVLGQLASLKTFDLGVGTVANDNRLANKSFAQMTELLKGADAQTRKFAEQLNLFNAQKIEFGLIKSIKDESELLDEEGAGRLKQAFGNFRSNIDRELLKVDPGKAFQQALERTSGVAIHVKADLEKLVAAEQARAVELQKAKALEATMAALAAEAAKHLDALATALENVSSQTAGVASQFRTFTDNFKTDFENAFSDRIALGNINQVNPFENVDASSLEEIDLGMDQVRGLRGVGGRVVGGGDPFQGIPDLVKSQKELPFIVKDSLGELEARRAKGEEITNVEVSEAIKRNLEKAGIELPDAALRGLENKIEASAIRQGGAEKRVFSSKALEELLKSGGEVSTTLVDMGQKGQNAMKALFDASQSFKQSIINIAQLQQDLIEKRRDMELSVLDKEMAIRDKVNKAIGATPDAMDKAVGDLGSRLQTLSGPVAGSGVAGPANVLDPQSLLNTRQTLLQRRDQIRGRLGVGAGQAGGTAADLTAKEQKGLADKLGKVNAQLNGTTAALKELANDTRLLAAIEEKIHVANEKERSAKGGISSVIEAFSKVRKGEMSMQDFNNQFQRPLQTINKIRGGQDIGFDEGVDILKRIESNDPLIRGELERLAEQRQASGVDTRPIAKQIEDLEIGLLKKLGAATAKGIDAAGGGPGGTGTAVRGQIARLIAARKDKKSLAADAKAVGDLQTEAMRGLFNQQEQQTKKIFNDAGKKLNSAAERFQNAVDDFALLRGTTNVADAAKRVQDADVALQEARKTKDPRKIKNAELNLAKAKSAESQALANQAADRQRIARNREQQEARNFEVDAQLQRDAETKRVQAGMRGEGTGGFAQFKAKERARVDSLLAADPGAQVGPAQLEGGSGLEVGVHSADTLADVAQKLQTNAAGDFEEFIAGFSEITGGGVGTDRINEALGQGAFSNQEFHQLTEEQKAGMDKLFLDLAEQALGKGTQAAQNLSDELKRVAAETSRLQEDGDHFGEVAAATIVSFLENLEKAGLSPQEVQALQQKQKQGAAKLNQVKRNQQQLARDQESERTLGTSVLQDPTERTGAKGFMGAQVSRGAGGSFLLAASGTDEQQFEREKAWADMSEKQKAQVFAQQQQSQSGGGALTDDQRTEALLPEMPPIPSPGRPTAGTLEDMGFVSTPAPPRPAPAIDDIDPGTLEALQRSPESSALRQRQERDRVSILADPRPPGGVRTGGRVPTAGTQAADRARNQAQAEAEVAELNRQAPTIPAGLASIERIPPELQVGTSAGLRPDPRGDVTGRARAFQQTSRQGARARNFGVRLRNRQGGGAQQQGGDFETRVRAEVTAPGGPLDFTQRDEQGRSILQKQQQSQDLAAPGGPFAGMTQEEVNRQMNMPPEQAFANAQAYQQHGTVTRKVPGDPSLPRPAARAAAKPPTRRAKPNEGGTPGGPEAVGGSIIEAFTNGSELLKQNLTEAFTEGARLVKDGMIEALKTIPNQIVLTGQIGKVEVELTGGAALKGIQDAMLSTLRQELGIAVSKVFNSTDGSTPDPSNSANVPNFNNGGGMMGP